jgi:hypothetical protein
MNTMELEEIKLVGLALKAKTSNINEQSSIDCGNLWQEFEEGKYADLIPNKLSDEILAVYHDYEGDHTQPFSYFIGCKVKPDIVVPPGLEMLTIPKALTRKYMQKEKCPIVLRMPGTKHGFLLFQDLIKWILKFMMRKVRIGVMQKCKYLFQLILNNYKAVRTALVLMKSVHTTHQPVLPFGEEGSGRHS